MEHLNKHGEKKVSFMRLFFSVMLLNVICYYYYYYYLHQGGYVYFSICRATENEWPYFHLIWLKAVQLEWIRIMGLINCANYSFFYFC